MSKNFLQAEERSKEREGESEGEFQSPKMIAARKRRESAASSTKVGDVILRTEEQDFEESLFGPSQDFFEKETTKKEEETLSESDKEITDAEKTDPEKSQEEN